MFEKSKSAITFKEFQDTLNTINNFDNEWGHFCDPDNNNNINNIIQNNFYQPTKIKEIEIKIKKPTKIEIKIKEEKEEKIKEQIEKEEKIKEQIEKEEKIKEQIEKEEKIKEQIKISIIKNIFNYTIIISISISFYVIYKLSKTGGRGGL
jgi:preprotein translocase subunit SecF